MSEPVKTANGVWQFPDGWMIAESIIDDELNRSSGRVTREDAKHLAMVAAAIRQERDQLKAQLEDL